MSVSSKRAKTIPKRLVPEPSSPPPQSATPTKSQDRKQSTAQRKKLKRKLAAEAAATASEIDYTNVDEFIESGMITPPPEMESEADDESPAPDQPETPKKPKKFKTHGSFNSACCPHCLTRQPNGGGQAFCIHPPCSLRMDMEFNHPQNAHIMSTRGQQKHTPAPSRSTLSTRDREFELIATAGDGYPRFDDLSTCPISEAATIMRGSFRAAMYEPLSEMARAAIISGKITQLGSILPRLLTSIVTDTGDTQLCVNADGQTTFKEKNKVVTINNLDDFNRAVLGSIIPSLYQQQRAVLDWCALSITIMELNHRYNWHTASTYLQSALSQAVHLRRPIGMEDRTVMNDTIITAGPPRHAGAPTRTPGGNQQSIAAPAEPRTCRDWNFKECTHSSCQFTHTCFFRRLKTCTKLGDHDHKGKDCGAFDQPRATNRPPYGKGADRRPKVTVVKAESIAGSTAARKQ